MIGLRVEKNRLVRRKETFGTIRPTLVMPDDLGPEVPRGEDVIEQDSCNVGCRLIAVKEQRATGLENSFNSMRR